MKKYRLIIVVGALALVGFFLWPTGVFKPVKSIFYQVAKPFTIVGNVSIGRVSGFFHNLSNLGAISKQNQSLIKENLELQSQLALLKEAGHENEILKQELGFINQKGDLKLTPANIIGRSFSGYLKTLVIDRGLKDNIKNGLGVISQGHLVGVVKEASENTSEIVLITDYNSLVPVILEDSRGTGLLRGGLNGLTVEDIPLNIPIKNEEKVLTSGLGGDIPGGILIGKIGEVVSKEGEIFQKVTVNSPIQIYYLEFVFVVQP